MAWYDDIRDTASGAGESVLELLGWLDKPQNALQVALYDLVHGEGPTGERTWEGLKSGWHHDVDRTWTDVLGVDRPSSEDPWGEWLLRGAAHYGPDFLLDPLLIAGKLSKAGKGIRALRSYQKASEAIHGSPIGRIALTGVPAHVSREFNAPLLEAQRTSRELAEPAIEAFQRSKAAEKAAGITPENMLEFRHWFERPNLQGQLPEELLGTWGEQQRIGQSYFDLMNETLERAGRKPVRGIEPTEFYRFTPRVVRGHEPRVPGGGRRGGTAQLGPEDWSSRRLTIPIEPEAAGRGIFKPLHGPTVPGSYYSPLVPDPLNKNRWFLREASQEIPVKLEQATLKDIVEAGATGGREFIDSVSDSFLAHTMKTLSHNAYFESLAKWREQGWIKGKGDFAEWEDPLKMGYEKLKAPGAKGQYGKKWLARQLEKKSRQMYDPETPLGMVEQVGDVLLGTRLGQMFRDGTTWWKRNVLNHPGFYIANMVSDLGLMHPAMHPYMIPYRYAQGIAVRIGYGSPVIEGYTNTQLGKEFAIRGINRAGQLHAEASDILREAKRGKGYVRSAAEALPGPLQPAGKAVAWAGEKYGRFNDIMLGRLGGAIEGNSRVAVAIHWLKENVPGKPTPAQLDEAAAYADRIMIDYGNLTPAMQQAQAVIPFITFYRGMLGRLAETLIEQPLKLANQGRLLDLAMDPMTGRDKRIADPWVQEGAPITGFGGVSFDKMAELLGGEPNPTGSRYALAGRFLPWTTGQQLINRPMETFLSSINPGLKAPVELAANYSQFFGMPIDRASGGAPWNVLNPALNWLGMEDTPYSVASRRPLGISGVPAAWDYMLSQSAPGRTVGEITELGRAAGLWEDPYRAELSPLEAFTWWLTGGKFYPYNRPKFERRRKWEAKEKETNLKSQLNYALKKGDAAAYAHYRQQLDEERRRQREMLSFVEG